MDRTCVEGTAEVRAAVALAPARAARLSSGGVATALTPHAQLVVAALLILGARLGGGGGKEEKTSWIVSMSQCGALKRSLRRGSLLSDFEARRPSA